MGPSHAPAARVLRTHELALHISRTEALENRDLASLALVCRALASPATDALWTTMDSLLPLFQAFPRDMWRVELNRSSQPQLVLTRQPRSIKEFYRVGIYARKIKALKVADVGVAPASLAFIVRILAPSGALLPALRSLELDPKLDDALLGLVLRLPGCLLVSLRVFKPLICLSEYLGYLWLFICCLELEKVTIVGDYVQDLAQDDDILDYTQEAHAPNVLMRLLGSLPKLSTLELDNHLLSLCDDELGVPPNYLSFLTDREAFNSLTSFSLTVPHLDMLSLSVVRQLNSRRITRIDLPRLNGTNQSDIEQHLDAISRLPCADVLEQLEVRMSHLYERTSVEDIEETKTDCETALRPLLRLHALRYLRFENDNLWASPSFLRELAKALPNIERLFIRQTELLTDYKYPKLAEALPPFSHHCPNLVYLGLDVDMCGPIPDPQLSTDTRTSSLYTLCIGFGKALYDRDEGEEGPHSELAIARYLRALFPNLVEIGGTPDDSSFCPVPWVEVNELLKGCNPPALPADVTIPQLSEYI